MTNPKPPSDTDEQQEPGKRYERTRYHILLFAVGIAIFVIVGALVLDWYIDPRTSTQKKDLIQALGLITAGVAGAVGIFFTWRGQRLAREAQEHNQKNTLTQLRNAQEQLRLARQSQEGNQKNTQEQLEQSRIELDITRQGQITERFTRAIDQLGSEKLEIRLGGIYALERIAWDSPERDYSTVMEVLTAYVRENTSPPAGGPSKGALDAASTSNKATAKADERAKQLAPAEPRRSTADIQAILDVLSRAQARVSEDYRTRLDLHETNLVEADLREADLRGANLRGAVLRGATLVEANLRGATLVEANLRGATLREADLGGAELRRADLLWAYLQRAHLRGANLLGANLLGADLGGATLVGAELQGADLRRADLQRANFQQAYLREADLRGADLRGANLQTSRGVMQDQIDCTVGSSETKLPEDLDRPGWWNRSIEEQKNLVRKHIDTTD
jgi:uncharacterized protein YjbI with pentapeptide repeats